MSPLEMGSAMRRAWKRLLRSFLGLLNLPLFEIGFAQHGHGGAHLKMAEAAQLRTRYLENTQLIGLEVHRDFHPRDDILFLRSEERRVGKECRSRWRAARWIKK